MTKGPGKTTSGDGIIGLCGAPITAPRRSADGRTEPFRPAAGHADCRMRTTTGDSCSPLKKTDPNHDR